MPQRLPRESVGEVVWDQTFVARKHAHLLRADDLVDDAGVRALQVLYRDERSPHERQRLALAFEKAVRGDRRGLADLDEEEDDGPRREQLEAELVAVVNAGPVPVDAAKRPARAGAFRAPPTDARPQTRRPQRRCDRPALRRQRPPGATRPPRPPRARRMSVTLDGDAAWGRLE